MQSAMLTLSLLTFIVLDRLPESLSQVLATL